MQVANHFYKDVAVPFLCLVCKEDKLTAEVKYEAPAAVGDKEAIDKSATKSDGDATAFPHLVRTPRVEGWMSNAIRCIFRFLSSLFGTEQYGAINLDAVIAELEVSRTDDGTFMAIEAFEK